jgi:hypothetical protein
MRHVIGGFALGLALLAAGCASTRGGPEPAPDSTGAPTASELAYLTNQNDASVSIIDMEAMRVIETIDLTALGYSPTAKPHHTAVEPDGSHWYVTLISDGRILKFDRDNRLVGEAEFETPGLLALDPNSERMYVGRSMAAVNPPPRIGVIDRSDMALEEVDVFFPRPHAIAVARDRGVEDVRAIDVADVADADAALEGTFDTVLMLGSNFGLVGTADRAPEILSALAAVTGPDGRIVAGSMDPTDTGDEAHLAYHEDNRERGRFPGAIRMRVRFETVATAWYDFLHAAPDTMRDLVEDTPWTVAEIVDGEGGHYVARREKA